MLISTGVLTLALGCALAGFLIRKHSPKKKKKTLGMLLLVLGLWLFCVKGIGMVFGPAESHGFTVDIMPGRVSLLGLSLSSTVVITWGIMVVLIALAALLRILVVPRMQEVPHGVQNVLELAVGGIGDYASSQAGNRVGRRVSSYLFTLCLLMISSAMAELLDLRAPTSDITMTLAMALITFFLLNYYGLREKGFIGRIKALGSPTPIVFPFRVISDIAVPVSLACRLFGNMLGGMIIIDLLYNTMGHAAVGLPGVVGVYFNIAHPLIQTFIFVTLTLTFIREAAE
ncbi:MAG: F0F1 ATP synthase subunit A [Christensenellaceae bacterium]|jgi:F-type H+-transporting ATPase subunit a|nr:F0F1 ATP synthase subunit A [Christensenellaceae bacterium]